MISSNCSASTGSLHGQSAGGSGSMTNTADCPSRRRTGPAVSARARRRARGASQSQREGGDPSRRRGHLLPRRRPRSARRLPATGLVDPNAPGGPWDASIATTCDRGSPGPGWAWLSLVRGAGEDETALSAITACRACGAPAPAQRGAAALWVQRGIAACGDPRRRLAGPAAPLFERPWEIWTIGGSSDSSRNGNRLFRFSDGL